MAIKYLFVALFVGALVVATALSVGTKNPLKTYKTINGQEYEVRDGAIVVGQKEASEEARKIAERY